jgi:hypothetical protein
MGGPMGGGGGFACVRLRGLPFGVTERDIVLFLVGGRSGMRACMMHLTALPAWQPGAALLEWTDAGVPHCAPCARMMPRSLCQRQPQQPAALPASALHRSAAQPVRHGHGAAQEQGVHGHPLHRGL